MYFSCWPTQTPPIHWMGMLQPCTFTGETYSGGSWIETKFVFYESVYCRPEEYKKKVAEYVKKYATEDALRETDKVLKSRGHCRVTLFSPFRRISHHRPRARCQIFRRTRQKTWNYNLSASWVRATVMRASDFLQTDGQCYCRWSLLHHGPKCTMIMGRTVQWCAIS